MLTFVQTFVCSNVVLSLAVLLKVSFCEFSIRRLFNKTGWSLSSIVGSSGSPDSWLTTTTKNLELLVALKNLCIVSCFTFFVLFV